jgi:16S rRNA pseudouridine516 synthase
MGLSRKQTTRLLRAKAVTDQAGTRLDDPRTQLTPTELPRVVLVHGEPVTLRTRFDLLLHKPVGVVTAHADARHATAYALLRDAPLFGDLRAVGRLDLDTSGLLVWTTDGTAVHKLTHPRYAIPRTYHAGLAGPWSPPGPDLCLDDGHVPRIVDLRAIPEDQAHPALRRSEGTREHASITITTGRFHEVRRIFAALGSEVLDLCRVAYGPMVLPTDLPPGGWRPLDLATAIRGLSPVA